MVAQDVAETLRIISTEANSAQRWSESKLLNLIDRAQKLVVRKILWPPSIYVFQTQTGVQRYQEPQILETLQVYVNGAICIRTDIETLEGDDINFWDNTGTTGGPGGLIDLNEEPTLAGGQFSPQWAGTPAQAYPVAVPLGFDVNVASPWTPGMRQRYFFDGGLLGLMPPPAGVYPVVVRCVRHPADLKNDKDQMVLPDICFDAVMWQAMELIAFSNADQPGAADQRNYALTQKEKALRALGRWKNQYDGSSEKGPNFLTYRSLYNRGNNRNWNC